MTSPPLHIVLDPGHGGGDPGGRSLGRPEKQLVLEFQGVVWKYLAGEGHRVQTTRVQDLGLPIGARADYANRMGAQLFLSLHCNASGAAAVRGPWTIYAAPSPRGKALGEAVQRQLAGVVPWGKTDAAYPDESPWVGGRRLGVLRQTRMVALLLEFGFMTNLEELRLLESQSHQARCAAAVAAGIRGWKP